MKRCTPHQWNIEDWMPLFEGVDLAETESCIRCVT